MHQLVHITVALLLVCFVSLTRGQRSIRSVLTVSNGAPWGDWSHVEMCPWGYYTAGFSLKVESPIDGDDTALNGISLYCVNPGAINTQFTYYPTATSGTGRFQCTGGEELTGDGTPWGNWGGWSQWCTGTGICGIQTKIEASQGSGDDTSLNDVRFFCCD